LDNWRVKQLNSWSVGQSDVRASRQSGKQADTHTDGKSGRPIDEIET
jgi:hypothetical protein